MTAQQDVATLAVAYLLLAVVVAGLVAVVLFALRARPRHRAARSAGEERAVLGLLGASFVVTAAVVGAVLGWRVSAPNGD
ncbi:MAG: hypothetical protein OYL92_10270 [Acidobacteriota bacterium]|nr:hypothetical protein [Acidobacteriota bacterium]MDE3265344.1 hypothetical protein [Acidobacteriota bacterium]